MGTSRVVSYRGGEGDSVILWEGEQEVLHDNSSNIPLPFPVGCFSRLEVLVKIKRSSDANYSRAFLINFNTDSYAETRGDVFILGTDTYVTFQLSMTDNSITTLPIAVSWPINIDKCKFVKVIGIY